MKIDLAQSLSELARLQGEGESEDKNPILLALDIPQVKTALISLIINEIRAFKTNQIQMSVNGIMRTESYDTHAGFSKLSAWVDLLDIPAMIEAKTSVPDMPQEESLPDA